MRVIKKTGFSHFKSKNDVLKAVRPTPTSQPGEVVKNEDLLEHLPTLDADLKKCFQKRKITEPEKIELAEKKKDTIVKSLINNQINYGIEDGSLVVLNKPNGKLSHNAWIISFLSDDKRSIDEKKFEEYESFYFFKNSFIDTKKTYAHNREIKKELYQFEQDLKNKKRDELHSDTGKNYYFNEVRKYIEMYFPLKRERDSAVELDYKNMRYDKKLKKKVPSKKIKSDYVEKYLDVDYVKQTVRNKILNELTLQIIFQGKLIQNFYNEGEDKWEVENFTSDHLIEMQLNENFQKKIINSIVFGNLALNNLLCAEEVDDLVGGNKLPAHLTDNVTFEYAANNQYIMKLEQHFNCLDDLPDALPIYEDLQNVLKKVRNKIIHIKHRKSLEELFNVKTESPFFKLNMERDFELLNDAFKEKIRSAGLANHYSADLLKRIFDRISFGLSKDNIPFRPSFKSVYSKGLKMQNSDSGYLLSNNDWFRKLDYDSDTSRVYRNFMKLVYENVFLQAIEHDENLITQHINLVIKKNSDYNDKNNRPNKFSGVVAKKYADIPLYKNEGVTKYFAIYQSLLMLEANKNNGRYNNPAEQKHSAEKFSDFMLDLFSYAFNAYLENEFKSMKVELQDLSKLYQNDIIEMNISDLNVNINVDKTLMSDDNLCFYAFAKLLDNKELGLLSSDFGKYMIYSENLGFMSKSVREKFKTYQSIIRVVMLTSPKFDPSKNDLSRENYENLHEVFLQGTLNDFDDFYFDIKANTEEKPIKMYSGLIKLEKSGLEKMYSEKLANNYKISVEEYHQLMNFKKENNYNIAELVKERELLHAKLVKGKSKDFNQEDVNRYKELVEQTNKYNNLRNKLEFTDLSRIVSLHFEILGRLVGYVIDFERDFYYFMTFFNHNNVLLLGKEMEVNHAAEAIQKLKDQYGENFNPEKIKPVNSFGELFSGNMGGKYSIFIEMECPETQKTNRSFHEGVVRKLFLGSDKNWIDTRNSIAHFHNLLVDKDKKNKNKKHKSIVNLINATRDLMSYDRKRKNAVTTSMKELLGRHNLDLIFQKNDGAHTFRVERVSSKKIQHLKGKNCAFEVPVHDAYFEELVVTILRK